MDNHEKLEHQDKILGIDPSESMQEDLEKVVLSDNNLLNGTRILVLAMCLSFLFLVIILGRIWRNKRKKTIKQAEAAARRIEQQQRDSYLNCDDYSGSRDSVSGWVQPDQASVDQDYLLKYINDHARDDV